MNKRDYFVKAIQAGAYRYKRWIIEAFTITRSEPGDEIGDHPYALYRDPDHGYAFHDPVTNEPVFIEGIRKDSPPFAFMEAMSAFPGDLPNLKEGVSTTYGQFLVNAYVLVHAFNDRIPYMNGEISAKRLESEVAKRFADQPKVGEERDPDKIYTEQYLEFGKAAISLEGLASICVVSATPKTLTCDPLIAKRRKELLEQYKDRLNDPIIQEKIEAELKRIDRDWMRGDPGERFFLKSEMYDVVRKKMFLLQGASEGMGSDTEYITDPITDGWKPDHIPAIINNLRDGSYSRGAQTALGGEQTKFLYRIFQNSRIVEDDCGTKRGMRVLMTEELAERYISNNYLEQGKTIEITKENAKSLIGKTIEIRYPTYCITPNANYCAACMGKELAKNPNALSSYSASIGSTFMLSMMAAMHGKALRTQEVDFVSSLS